MQVPTLTLSQGRYAEFFPNDSLRRIGSVIYDTRRHRIAYLIPTDWVLGEGVVVGKTRNGSSP